MQGFVAWVLIAVLASWCTVLVKRKRRLARVIIGLHLQGKSQKEIVRALIENCSILDEAIREKEDKRWQVGIASCGDSDSLARVKKLHEQIAQYDIELAALRMLRTNINWALAKLS